MLWTFSDRNQRRAPARSSGVRQRPIRGIEVRKRLFWPHQFGYGWYSTMAAYDSESFRAIDCFGGGRRLHAPCLLVYDTASSAPTAGRDICLAAARIVTGRIWRHWWKVWQMNGRYIAPAVNLIAPAGGLSAN